MVYYSVIHNMSLRQIAAIVDIPFSTVRQTINDYLIESRTNHMASATYKAKLLEDKVAYRRVICQRRKRIDARK